MRYLIKYLLLALYTSFVLYLSFIIFIDHIWFLDDSIFFRMTEHDWILATLSRTARSIMIGMITTFITWQLLDIFSYFIEISKSLIKKIAIGTFLTISITGLCGALFFYIERPYF